MSSLSSVPRTGEEFAGYHLVSLIGHGGMSIVYRAEHRAPSDFRERFQRESRVAASLEHPNIVTGKR
jgi:serine/threonine protein kinase